MSALIPRFKLVKFVLAPFAGMILLLILPNKLSAVVDDTIVVRLSIHSIFNGDTTLGPTEAEVDAAIAVMETDFAVYDIYFYTVVHDSSFSDFVYATDHYSRARSVRPPDDNAINIYLFEPNYTALSEASIPNNPSDLSMTVCGSDECDATERMFTAVMTHEMGHCLGLWHPWQGGPNSCQDTSPGNSCDECGDLVCDTPPMPESYECDRYTQGPYCRPVDPISCQPDASQCPPPPISEDPDDRDRARQWAKTAATTYGATTNYMTWSWPECMDHFTDGQVDRMKTTVDTSIFYRRHTIGCGDLNANGLIDDGDRQTLTSYLFAGGSAPYLLCVGDVNNDGVVGLPDLMTLIGWINAGTTEPSSDCLDDCLQ